MEQFIPNYEDKTAAAVEDAIRDNLEFRLIKSPANGVKAYMPHQVIFAREMTIQKRMICCHPMGSGKTCSIFFAAQVALRSNLINHVLFVGPKTVLPQARDQFAVKCPSATNDLSRITFITFDKFLDSISSSTEEGGLKFPGYMIVIDEAHNRLPNKYRASFGIRDSEVAEDAVTKKDKYVDRVGDWSKIKAAIQSSTMTILATGTFVVNDLVEPIALADAISPVSLNWADFAHEVNGRKVFKPDGEARFARATKNFFSFIDPKTEMPLKETIGEGVSVTDDGSAFELIIDKVPMREWNRFEPYRSVSPGCKFSVDARTLDLENDCDMIANLDTVAPKHKRVLQLASQQGVSVIYTEHVVGEGVLLYGALLKAMGYTWYEGKDDIVDAKKRFAIIMGNTKPKHVERILKIHNSSENWDGSLIKIILITNAARDGISLFYAEQFIMEMCPWHIAGYDQAVARAVRADSHILWKMRKKGQLVASGMTESEAQREIDSFKVKVYNVAHYPSDADPKVISVAKTANIPDLRRLALCFRKKHYNAAVVSLIHSNSIECNLLKKLDISYSDYRCCTESVWNPVANMQNYNSMFLEDDADLRIQELKAAGYMQPTRVPLVEMLTMEKILETSIIKRTPSGIQCFQDSDGQSSFSSYFYSMGFADLENPVVWNDDFYCRNSCFVHDECRRPVIQGDEITKRVFLDEVIANINVSNHIGALVERMIAQDETNFVLINKIFPAHLKMTRANKIFHMFLPTGKERYSGYFRSPCVSIFDRQTKEWSSFEYSKTKTGAGMGKRTTDFKETYRFDGAAWRSTTDMTRLTEMDSEISDYLLNNVARMDVMRDSKMTFAFIVDNNDLRIVFTSNGNNRSGRLFNNMNAAGKLQVSKLLGFETVQPLDVIVRAFSARKLILPKIYNLLALREEDAITR